MYQKVTKFLRLFFSNSLIFKYGFNISPMYSRITGKIIFVSDDLHQIDIIIPISIKNRNYVGSIFGGSLFAATDPILINSKSFYFLFAKNHYISTPLKLKKNFIL